MDILDGAADERSSQDALGYLRRLLLPCLGLQMEKRQIDIALQVWTEPRLEVCFLRCGTGQLTRARLLAFFPASEDLPAFRFL